NHPKHQHNIEAKLVALQVSSASNGGSNSSTQSSTNQPFQLLTRAIDKLQEDIDVAESTNDAFPTSKATLMSIELSDVQSAEESVGLRTSMVEAVTPVVCMPLLNEITYASPQSILIKSSSSNFDPPPLPPLKPPDQSFSKIIVELHVICNLMMPPPPPKPLYAIHGDVNITVLLSCLEIVCANRMVIKTELSTDSDHCILREDLVDGNRYDISILELAFVPFNALILYVKCSKSFAHKVVIYIFQVWNAHHVFDVMPKMIVFCSNSLNVGFITAGVLDEKIVIM
ncbi:hypothetical protein A2U01_0004453, partial [Trifolium medium]|nr:hypothetical protein [Trifolium medium]